MKPTKFIILAEDSDYVQDNCVLTDEQRERLAYCDYAELRVISCTHPKFEDNVVTVHDECGDEHSLVRDVNGMLWNYSDYVDRNAAIKVFE